LPIESIKEGRLWLRKGIKPLLSGQPDEILLAGKRAAVLDYKFGASRVSDPGENFQLAVYSLLAARSDDAIGAMPPGCVGGGCGISSQGTGIGQRMVNPL
jgi:PD-(D/E)XK nuclease superfamily protein